MRAPARLRREYSGRRSTINRRLSEFRAVGRGTDEDIFRELVFCLMTPQSKARSCWSTVETLCERDLLLRGRREDLAAVLNRVRFRNNKAKYIVEARRLFTSRGRLSIKDRLKGLGPREARDWLVRNVKGMGMKEASHFLRNIGMGKDLAILDRHILGNLVRHGVIRKVPTSMTRRRYLDIEEAMRGFSREVGIPMAHLDLLFWRMETGEVFK